MRSIKMLSREIEQNIVEADDKIETAYSLKAQKPAIAAWFKEMAQAHLSFNQKGHDLIADEINSYKESQEYKEHPEYADGMMSVWKDKHAELIAKAARVKSMIDSFK